MSTPSSKTETSKACEQVVLAWGTWFFRPEDKLLAAFQVRRWLYTGFIFSCYCVFNIVAVHPHVYKLCLWLNILPSCVWICQSHLSEASRCAAFLVIWLWGDVCLALCIIFSVFSLAPSVRCHFGARLVHLLLASLCLRRCSRCSTTAHFGCGLFTSLSRPSGQPVLSLTNQPIDRASTS